MIAEAVREAMDKRSDKVLADPYWAMTELRDLYYEARAEGPKGHATAAKTLDMILRRLGLYTDTIKNVGPDTWNVEIIIPNRTGAD